MKVYQHLHAANHIANYTELNMAETNFKPEFTVFKTESDAFNSITENRDLIRKNDIRRLHGNRVDAAPIHPRAKTQEGSSACYEIYSRVDCKYLPP